MSASKESKISNATRCRYDYNMSHMWVKVYNSEGRMIQSGVLFQL